MSITITPRNHDLPDVFDPSIGEEIPHPDSYVNMAELNAIEVFRVMGLRLDEGGSIRSKLLRDICDQTIAAIEAGAIDDGVRLGYVQDNIFQAVREAGYLKHRIAQIRKLTDLAGDLGYIDWA